jgi:hypothetical protein
MNCCPYSNVVVTASPNRGSLTLRPAMSTTYLTIGRPLSGIICAPSGTSATVLTSPFVATELLKEPQRLNPAERRRSPRIRLQVPVFLRGIDTAGGDFLELTKTINISSTGACIACSHAVRVEQAVQLTIPAPSPSASGLVPPETPPLSARVRRVQPVGDLHLVGVEFLRPLD